MKGYEELEQLMHNIFNIPMLYKNLMIFGPLYF